MTFDFDAFCAQADNLAAYLLAELDALCKGFDESLYNSRANLLVFENDSEEDQDNDIEGTRSATAL